MSNELTVEQVNEYLDRFRADGSCEIDLKEHDAALRARIEALEQEKTAMRYTLAACSTDEENRLRERVQALEAMLETQRTATYQAVEREHTVKRQLAAMREERDAARLSLGRVDWITNCKACRGRGVWRDRLTENEWGDPYPCPQCTQQLTTARQQVMRLREALHTAPVGVKGQTNGDVCAAYYAWFDGIRKQALAETEET